MPRYEKPSILTQLPAAGHVVVEASAGTGKTFALEHIVAQLVLEGARIDEILLVTFTEKATGELRLRVRVLLEKLLNWTDAAPGVPDDRCWPLDDTARTRLSRALLAIDSATIATIHSFCQRVLMENAFAHKRLFVQTQVDSRAVFADAFKDAVRTELAVEPKLKEYLKSWLAQATLESLEKFLYDVADQRGQRKPAWDEAGFRRAVGRLVSGHFEIGAEARLKAAEIHSSTVKAVARRLSELDVGDPSMLPAPELLRRVGDWIDGKNHDTIGYIDSALAKAPRPSAWTKELRDTLRELRASYCSFDAAVTHEFLPRITERIVRRKREHGLFDFDDMLSLVHESLHDARTGASLIRSLRERYRFALIDEFQDTDEIQWGIFRKLFFESESGHRLFLVGDPKQSIYRFRGADVQTYIAARDAIVSGGGARLALTENFRSTPDLISAVNLIFDQSPPAYFTGDIRYDEPVTCGDPSLGMTDEHRNPVKPVRVLHVMTEEGRGGPEIARRKLRKQIVREIHTILRGPGLYFTRRGERRRVGPRDIYCLTASNNEGVQLGKELSAAGLPIAYYKQDGLFQTSEARDTLDLLLAIADPQDRRRRMRAWMTPFFGARLDDLAATGDLPGSHPLLAQLFDWHALAEDRQFARLFARIVEDSGIVRREIFWGASDRLLTNYLHLFETLLEEANRARGTIDELVRKLASYIARRAKPPGEDGNVQRLQSDEEAIQILTMHKAKGLEAAVVFIAGGFAERARPPKLTVYHDAGGQRTVYLGWLLDPDAAARAEREQRDERQRQLYVALTRAKGRLYLPFFGRPFDSDLPDLRPGAKPAPYRFEGVYRPVHDRLGQLVYRSEIERTLIDGPVAPVVPEVPAPSAGVWSPPESLLQPEAPGPDYATLRHQHRGLVVTSYSQLSRELEATDFKLDLTQPAATAPEDSLPGGALMGVYLHELLENLPIAPTREGFLFDVWKSLPDVRDVLTTAAEHHSIPPMQADIAAKLVFRALTSPVDLPDGRRLQSFSHSTELLREMEFLYPIPEGSHPKLGAATRAKQWSVERGFIKGFVDLIFEHDGRAYFADWKSDRLASWDAASLKQHVDESYLLQAKLYSLAMAKLLDLRTEAAFEARFGGLLYVFLRGLMPETANREWLYSWRPSWSDLLKWEDELIHLDLWEAA